MDTTSNADDERASPAQTVDPDDAPELTDEFFERADHYCGDKLVKAGRGRPAGPNKTAISLRVDNDVLLAFRETGGGWQTRMNDALREWLKGHVPAGANQQSRKAKAPRSAGLPE